MSGKRPGSGGRLCLGGGKENEKGRKDGRCGGPLRAARGSGGMPEVSWLYCGSAENRFSVAEKLQCTPTVPCRVLFQRNLCFGQRKKIQSHTKADLMEIHNITKMQLAFFEAKPALHYLHFINKYLCEQNSA